MKPLKRIFISYGRKDSLEFAQKLADWLRSQNFDPWLDIENGIPLGTKFDVEIEVGIAGSDVFLALLTPWSLRPEGFCRNEILYAQAVGKPIIPVRVSEIIPPIQIISLNYVDVASDPDSIFTKLPNAIQHVANTGNMGYREWDDSRPRAEWCLSLKPLNFEEELAEHGSCFVGRGWLYEHVREWIVNPASRILLITADTGFGKSAIAAQLSTCFNVRGIHFCTSSKIESCKAESWLSGLICQLSAQFPAFREKMEKLPTPPNWEAPLESLFRQLIADPLRDIHTENPEKLFVEEPWVFIIDGLDESSAQSEPNKSLTGLLVDSVSRIPNFIRIIITTRPDRDILAQFKLDGIQCCQLNASNESNTNDLRAYIERRLTNLYNHELVQYPETFISKLAELADGNFLFVKLTLDSLVDKNPDTKMTLEEIGSLPRNLGGVYYAMFRKRFKDSATYESDILPLLDCLIAAAGPLPEELLRVATGLAQRSTKRGLLALSQFLRGGAPGVRLFHKSLADWLSNESDSALFAASVNNGHKLLAAYAWDEYMRDSGQLSAYSLAYLPTHLIATCQWEKLEVLLTDLIYIEQRVAIGQVFDLVNDYSQTIYSLPESLLQLQDNRSRDECISRWICEVISYSQECGDRLEPEFPKPPFTCHLWTNEEIATECQRVIDNPNRLDRLIAFASFVRSECYPLFQYGNYNGFVLQQAFNYASSGPVREAAAKMIVNSKKSILSLRIAPDAVYNPKPALISSLEGHLDFIGSVSITPDGRYAVSGSSDNTLRVWNLRREVCLFTLKGHEDMITSVSVSFDGRIAVSGSHDNTLRVWDLGKGVRLHTLSEHTDVVTSVNVTPDGRHAVSGSLDGTLKLWDLKDAICLRTITLNYAVYSVAITADGRRVISGGENNSLCMLDLESKKRRFLTGHRSSIGSVSITPDGQRAVSGSYDGTVILWDLENGKFIRTIEGLYPGLTSPKVSITPDGQRALSIGADNALRFWDLLSGKRLRHFQSSKIACISLTADGRYAVSGCNDGTLQVWNLESGLHLNSIEWKRRILSGESVAFNGRRAVSVSSDGILRLWDHESGACLGTIDHNLNMLGVTGVSLLHDGRHAVTSEMNGGLRIWDLEKGTCRLINDHFLDKDINVLTLLGMSVLPDERFVVSGCTDGALRIWNLETGAILRVIEDAGIKATCMSVTPDGLKVVLGYEDGVLRVRDMENTTCILNINCTNIRITCMSVTPDGRRVVLGYEDGVLQIWDLFDGKRLCVLAGHSQGVTAAMVTSDGRRVVSSSSDKTLRIWDIENKDRHLLYFAHSIIDSVAISEEDNKICYSTVDGEVFFLDLCLAF